MTAETALMTGLACSRIRMGRGDAEEGEQSCMRPRLLRCLSAALAGCVILSAAAQAQVMPFRGTWGSGLSPQDSQLLFDSIARLNAAEPARVGRSEAWSNTQTNSSGTSTILRVFHSGGMVCHRLRHHIVIAGQQPGHDYRLTWCRTPSGEWKSKG
jgi:surface antigen